MYETVLFIFYLYVLRVQIFSSEMKLFFLCMHQNYYDRTTVVITSNI